MRALHLLVLALLLVPSNAWTSSPDGFQPSFEAMVLVTLSAPERALTTARLRLADVTVHAGARLEGPEPKFQLLESRELAGRAPRLVELAVEPTVIDSVVFHWSGVEVQIGDEWVSPAVGRRSSVLVLSTRVEAGEVLILNLHWDPDAQPASSPDWYPVLTIEEHREPPLGATLYASEEGVGVVAVYDRLSGRLVRGLPTGGSPRDLCWDELRQRLYVAVAGRDELLIFDPLGAETVRRVPLSFGSDPTRVVLTPDRKWIAVLAPGRDLVFFFSASSLQEVARVHVGHGPVGMVADPSSGRILVTSHPAGRIDAIDPEQMRVVAQFDQVDNPTDIVQVESGLFAVGDSRSRRIALIDPNSGARVSEMSVCGPVTSLVSVPRIDQLFAVSDNCRAVTLLRPASGLEVRSIRLDGRGGIPSLSPSGADVFLPLPDSARILVLASDRGSVTRVIDTGTGVWRVIAP